MNFKTLSLSAAVLGLATSASALTINKAEGWLESAYAEWAMVSGASSYNVYVDGVKIDNPLIRSYGSYMRADAVGLKAGSHTIKVEASNGETASKTVTVKAHDRSGFAFSNNRVPGAYNTDGTLKSGAVVVYVTEKTKNSVTADVTVDSKGTKKSCLSFQGILNCMKKGYETRPFDFRFIGNVTDSDSLVAGDMVIDHNKTEKSYVTVEGIGSDATANGWGIRLKGAQNVEVRNMGIMNVNSSEGDNIGLQQDNQYVWIHNNDMFYGDAGSDKDQVKGDGALDCKKSTYVTFSYNHFWDNGKSNLLGLSEGTTEGLYITYHHNWYDHSDSRHPRVRYYSAHVYNNYYDGNAKYGAGSTLGSSVFMESNYFRNCKFPMLTSMQGSDLYAGSTTSTTDNATFSKEAGGTIKAYNNKIAEGGTFIAYGATTYRLKGKDGESVGSIDTKTDFDAYVVSSRTEKVPSTVVSKSGGNTYNNFDVDNSIMYSYTADEPEAAKTNVMAYAGRVNGGDFKWEFTSADDELYEVNQPLKNALVAYKGDLKSIQGEGALVVIETPVVSSSSVVPASSSSSVKPAESSSSSSQVTEPAEVSSSSVENQPVVSGDASLTKHGSGSATQTVAAGSAIAEFYYTVAGATGATVTGLPDGLTGTMKGSDFYISGTVSATAASGAYNFTVTTTGASSNVSKTGTITVTGGAEQPESSSSEPPVSSSSEENPGEGSEDDGKDALAEVAVTGSAFHFDVASAQLVISANSVRRLDVVRMDGRKAVASMAGFTAGNVVDLSALRPGVYLVRAIADGKSFQQKILKK